MKFDKDMMTLLKATKKASKTLAAAIAERQQTHHDYGPLNESPARDQNIEPPPGVDTAQRFAFAFSESAASRRAASPPIGALSGNLRIKHGDLYLPPVTEKWSADRT